MAEVKKCNSYKMCFWVRNNNSDNLVIMIMILKQKHFDTNKFANKN